MADTDSDTTEADAPSVSSTPARERFVTAEDGLQLFAADYGDPSSPWTPVVCLPGLTRSHRDFAHLAKHLSEHRHRPRRVICPDYRGRGKSAWDKNHENYNPFTEMSDTYAIMAALGIPRAVFVGTSRGGIIGMFIGTDRPACLAGLVLVDIGAVIEPLGLARIKSYVGRTPSPNDWSDATAILKALHGGHFTGWSDSDWDEFTRLTFREDSGLPVSDYDPQLAETLAGVEFDQPLPDLWKEFNALAGKPLMLVHGANSDLLSEETVSAMAKARPDMLLETVDGEGHPPMLRGGALLKRISAFLTGIESPQDAAAQSLPPMAGSADD